MRFEFMIISYKPKLYMRSNENKFGDIRIHFVFT